MSLPTPPSSSPPVWHAQDSASVLAQLAVRPESGLNSAELAQRLAQHGENRLAERPPRPAWLKFLDQFRSLLVLILLGAGLLAGAVGEVKDAVVIVLVVLLNAALGFFQEHRAENALAALRNMLAPVARVRRGGEVVQVEAAQLVPGDILLLEAGDRIPADARVLGAHAAEVAGAEATVMTHQQAGPAGVQQRIVQTHVAASASPWPANSASSAATNSGAKVHARTPGEAALPASSPRQNR